MAEFYRVKKDNPLWVKGAIIELGSGGCGGSNTAPVSDIYNQEGNTSNDFFGKDTIRNSPDWFERVYEVSKLKQVSYEVKDKAIEMIGKGYEAK